MRRIVWTALFSQKFERFSLLVLALFLFLQLLLLQLFLFLVISDEIHGYDAVRLATRFQGLVVQRQCLAPLINQVFNTPLAGRVPTDPSCFATTERPVLDQNRLRPCI